MDNSLRKGRITHHSNKIGLFDTDDQSFINQSGDVVLSFPYRDCILEGGMSSEELGREEKFFHETIDRADIDVLREPKVLTGFEKIDKDGVYTITDPDEVEFFDAEGNLQENLLIKGNNLIALYSLRSRLAGKVKLIYIDPPYNTGNDGFRYNDSFNHSSWLVFMKNRLEIARELLREDGAIYVNLDYHEVHYAKILMDEIFGIDNFQREIIWRIGWLSGYKTIDNNFIRNHDSILFFSKNSSRIDFHKKYIQNENFKEIVKFPKLKEKLEELGLSKEKQHILIDFINHQSRPERYPIEDVWNGNEYDDLNSIAIVSFSGETVSKMLEDKEKEIKGQKSEKLIQRIIEAHTNEGDIILDYHLGSGTTAAVAHKMGRRWIGIEQMDYIEDIAKVRLQKVIEGEQGGISKSVNWQGDGDFIYMELRTYNIEYLEQIESARTKEDLHRVYVDMAKNAFLQFWFDRKNWEKDENYTSLPLEEQKIKLRELLDMNQLYLNTGDMYDTRHGVPLIDQSLTEKFYGKKN